MNLTKYLSISRVPGPWAARWSRGWGCKWFGFQLGPFWVAVWKR